jgi:hypothetical protein
MIARDACGTCDLTATGVLVEAAHCPVDGGVRRRRGWGRGGRGYQDIVERRAAETIAVLLAGG